MAQKKFMAQMAAVKDKRPINRLTAEENIKETLIVIDDLRNLIPPLVDDEFSQLEENLVKNGIRDAITVWETTAQVVSDGLDSGSDDLRLFEGKDPAELVYILVDGHNRYSVAKLKNLDFRVSVMDSFKSLLEVKDYMINYQLGRRNLKPDQISYLRGLRYNHDKKDPGGADNATGVDRINVAESLADEYGVSSRTIKRDAEFAQGIEKLTKEAKTDVLSGKTKISKKQIQALASGGEENIDKERLSEIVAEAERGGNKNIKKTQSNSNSVVGSSSKDLAGPSRKSVADNYYGFSDESNQLLDNLLDNAVLESANTNVLISELRSLVGEGDLMDKNVLNKATHIISLLSKKL